MNRTTKISLVSATALAGLAAGRLGWTVNWPADLALAGLGAVLLCRPRWRLLGWLVLALAAGLWRADGWLAQQGDLKSMIGQKVTVTAEVADDPVADPRGFTTFKLDGLVVDGRPTAGQLPVFMQRVNLHRGWRVTANGKVKPGFGAQAAELSYPRLTVESTAQSPLEKARQRFFVGMKTALPEPIASFALGLLVGIRALIPKGMQAQLTAVGLSHLVAVSGYNLTIIVAAGARILRRFGRGVTLAASFWLIGSFLVVTGASASIVRASLVATLSLLAAFYGRRFEPVTLILLTAASTALFNPAYLTDYGWLLSYLAFFGILVLAPAVMARLGNPKRLAAQLFIETSAAESMTLPLILYGFGNLSAVAPLANLLILPTVPVTMLLSFVAGLAGMVAPAFSGWLAWPAQLLLGLILQLVAALAALPLAGLTFHIDLPAMVVLYGLLLIVLLAVRRSNHRHGRTETVQPKMEPVLMANDLSG